MEAITESLVKKADEIKEYAANRQANVDNGMEKGDYQSTQPIDNGGQQESKLFGKNNGTSKSNFHTESGNTSNNTISGAGTVQTTTPVFPCEQVEVINLYCFATAQLPQKEIDGVIGGDTRNSIMKLVQAHYYSTIGASLEDDDEKVNDEKVNDDKMQAIVNK